MAESYSIGYRCRTSLSDSSVLLHFGGSVSCQLYAVVLGTLGCRCVSKVWFSLDIRPGEGLLGAMVFIFLLFTGTFPSLSAVDVPIYIPTKSVGGIGFSHPTSSMYFL